jgi:hypothetical protein
MGLRRDFNLNPEDDKFLEEYGLPWETIAEGAQRWVLMHSFPTHSGYNHPAVTIAVRLETGYPRTELNMVYVFPSLARTDGRPIGQVEFTQSLDGRSFQRWSRHRTAEGPWVPGVDNLESHVVLVEEWFVREFEK